MLALGIRYLTGYAVATDASNRERAEWPPHPARVFMALAAAHFETGEDAAERAALEWLEEQGPPAMRASEVLRREVVKCYVPVNDKAGPSKVTLQSVPGLTRDRKERCFPCVRPHDDTVYLVWPETEADPASTNALGQLCDKVIRIGHSSSLVQMWVEADPPRPNLLLDGAASLRLRIVGDGTLDYLKHQFNASPIGAYADLQSRSASAKGKAKGALKKELEERFPDGEPTTRRPTIGLWQGYRAVDGQGETSEIVSGLFDRDLMVLTLQDGATVCLETTGRLLAALRDTILSLCDPTPEWVSGHRPDGTPSQEPHLALVPLAFVGHPHADGHLLGVGLAFPKKVPPRERGAALRKLLYDNTGRSKPIDLRLGALGTWRIVRETRESPPLALQPQIWTAPARTWATVSPIVLDRHPKADYAKERDRWCQEVAQAIAESCRRQGLPEPMAIDVDKTSWHRGAPRAIPGKGGFPLLSTKHSQPARQQVHAWLRFDRDVEGPLLLGAGRYRGYGLCKPWTGGGQ